MPIYPKEELTLGNENFGEIEYSIPLQLTSDPTQYNKILNNIKYTIRKSPEYKNWVSHIHEKYGPVICCVSGNVITVEVHHYPLTLQDYIEMAISWLINKGYSLSTFLVSDVVMRMHYRNSVTGAFLAKTYHERYHKFHDITIPTSAVFGDPVELINDPVICLELTPDKLLKIETVFGKLNI